VERIQLVRFPSGQIIGHFKGKPVAEMCHKLAKLNDNKFDAK